MHEAEGNEKKISMRIFGKGGYFLNMTLVYLYKDEVLCYLKIQRLQPLRKYQHSTSKMLKGRTVQ